MRPIVPLGHDRVPPGPITYGLAPVMSLALVGGARKLACAYYSPPSSFCKYFNCIPSFWTSTNGYIEECVDETYSHSGGRSCSYHVVNQRPLYQP